MRRLLPFLFLVLLLPAMPAGLIAQQMSALIGQALDKPLSDKPFEFNGTLPQLIQSLGDMTGVRIEVSDAAYDLLPWGDQTTITTRFEHQTLRQALAAVCQKLGLRFDLQSEAILLRPLPALRRLARRCTLDELNALDLLARTPLSPAQLHTTAAALLASIDSKLLNSPYAIENRAFDPGDLTTVNVSRNASLLDAMEEISIQTRATWYPWGKNLVVLKKTDEIRMRLAKRMTTRFNGDDVGDVLLELQRDSGVPFQIQPAAFQKIPAKFRVIQLTVDDASIHQILESICGVTGLAYTITDDGVRITNPLLPESPATQPSGS